jgi:hypothetical protein
MPGGLLQIASSGVQDSYLTKNPEITFFKKNFKRHTKFSCETIEINLEGTPEYGNDFFIVIPKRGDLIHKCFFEIDIPKLNLDDSHISNKSYKTMKEASLKNNDNEMNRWLKEYNELTSFSNIQINFYQKIMVLLKSSDISYQSILTQATLDSKINSNILDQTVFKIDEDIKKKIDIISYVLNLNLHFDTIDDHQNNKITYETFLKNINTFYDNNLAQLKYYYSNYIYYKNKYNNINTGSIDYSWIENLGHHFFINNEVEIGGQVIEQYSNDHYNISQLNKVKVEQLDNYNKIIGNVPEINSLSSKKQSTKIYIPLNFWFNRESVNSLPLVALRYQDVKLNFTINNLNNLVYFYDYKKDYDNILIFEYPYHKHIRSSVKIFTPNKLSKVINNVEQLIYTKTEYLERERIYRYYCKKLTRGLLETKYPNILSTDLDYLFSTYGTNNEITFDQYLKFRTSVVNDSNLENVSLYILGNQHPNIANHNFLINKISNPSIKFFCEYVFLDAIEREKFARSKLEYVIDIPRQMSTDIGNNNQYSTEIDLLNPTKSIMWFFRPKTLVYGLNKYSYKNPSLYNQHDMYTEKIIKDFKLILQDLPLIDFKHGEHYYSTVTKNKNLNINLTGGYYYYTFSLFPNESQPSGNVNFSIIKGKYIQAQLNDLFLQKYFDQNINNQNLNIEFVLINDYYNLIKIDKGKLTSVFY